MREGRTIRLFTHLHGTPTLLNWTPLVSIASFLIFVVVVVIITIIIIIIIFTRIIIVIIVINTKYTQDNTHYSLFYWSFLWFVWTLKMKFSYLQKT